MACPAPACFPTLSHKRHDFRGGKKKVTEHKMCDSIFSTTSVWNISHSKKNWARYNKNIYRSSCELPDILVGFQRNSNFIKTFSKNLKTSYLVKIRSVTTDLFHADRQTRQSSQSRKRLKTTKHCVQWSPLVLYLHSTHTQSERRLKQELYWLVKFIQPINWNTRQLKRSTHYCNVNMYLKKKNNAFKTTVYRMSLLWIFSTL